MGLQRNRVRLEESRDELDQLQASIEQWLKRRRKADVQWQYRTQLRAVETVALATIASLREQVGDIPCSAGPEVYERCREADGRGLFVRRFWSYFRDRWDQRDDRELAPLLAAAEEVVWSCYAGPFRRADQPLGPAPLPYLDPQFSPHAIQRTRPPEEITTTDDLLEATLAELPVPVTGLPPICLRRPWWLVLLAHETGHHVEYDFGGGDLVDAVRDATVTAATSGGGEPDRGWALWSHELFADAFALASVGPAHRWALEELELATDGRMIADAGSYPPRAARRYFADLVLAILEGGDGAQVTPPAAPGEDRQAVRFRGIVGAMPRVALALVEQPLGAAGPLRELGDWQAGWHREGGDIAQVEQRLLADGPLPAQPGLSAARTVVAAAVQAWRGIVDDEHGDAVRREARRQHVAQRTLKLISVSREPGDRAPSAAAAPAGLADLATRIAAQLRHLEVATV